MIIQNVIIYDAIHKDPFQGSISIKDGKIAALGAEITPEAGEAVVDGCGLRAYPGFVDAHCHIGLDSFGGPTGTTYDYNEATDPITPQIRGMDSYNPHDPMVRKALEGGVTSVGAGPGSANVLGGTFLAVKTCGNTVDEAAINSAVAMKCAFGENPKRCYKNKNDMTRMGTASLLRGALFDARDYMLRKEAANGDITKTPKYDMKAEALIPVLKGEMPLKAHAHRADDIMTALRIAKEFGVKITIEHCTEGHLIAKELAAANVPVAVGPTMTAVSKLELWNKSFTTPGILQKAGLQVSIITDAPVILQEYLPLCAGLAVKAGMDPFAALQAITINPAKHLGIEDRVGSLEVGKDADIVLCDGDPMVSDTNIKQVYVNGELQFRQ